MTVIPRRGGSWVRRLAAAPLHWLPARTVVVAPFGPMRGMRWIPASAPHGAWLGRLERAPLEMFLARICRGMVVWDVGANVGLYSIPAARAAGTEGRVVAFEPIPRNVAYLRRHVELNGLSQVTIVEAAVVEQSGTVALMPGDSPSEARVCVGGPWLVRGVSLDDWQRSTGAALPALVKIDVEGAEDRVLAGAAGVLGRARPALFLSLHGDRQRAACRTLLTSWGYSVASLEPGRTVDETSEWLAEP